MPSPRPWLIYSLLRVGIFAAVFAVLALSGVDPILSAVIAAIVGLCVSYIFLRGQRDRVAADLHRRRTSSKVDRDGDAEDDVLDRADDASTRHPELSDDPSEGERDR